MSVAFDEEHGRDDAARAAAVRAVTEGAAFTLPFAVMNALATVVACYGLLQDSAAAVIGAMIIAMLLGPISGIALGLVNGDAALLRRAFAAEAGGAALALGIALALGLIHRDIPLTAQMLARTSPNLPDLMIALAGGAAGAYAAISPRISVGLVGVAIATALVPPLSTCGMCLARGEMRLAGGAFLLFLTNLVAIQFASSVVMGLHGFHRTAGRNETRRTVMRRNAFSFVVLVGLGVSFGANFAQSVAARNFERDTRTRLRTALRAYPGAYLADLRIRRVEDDITVTAVVEAPYSFVPERVRALQAALPSPPGRTLELHVRSIITKESTSEGYVNDAEGEPQDGVPSARP